MAKRILYIVGEYPSVTETFVQREIEGLRERGMSIEVCPLAGLVPGELLSAALRAPWQLCGLMLRHSRELDSCSWRRRIGSAVKALAIARIYPRVEHLHAHFLGAPALTAYYLSRVLHIPYSLTAHAHDIYVETTPSVVLKKARFRTTCTESNVRYMAEKEPTAPFVLVRHGIDAQYYDGERTSRAGKCHLLAVGRHVEKKGFRYLVEACSLLKSRGFSFHCRIIGDGPDVRKCRHQIESARLMEEVTLCPFMSHQELFCEYHAADILVVPSIVTHDGDRDGVPNVVLEAMASEVPVICSDAGSLCEAVQNDITGIVIAQRNAAALACAITKLWNDKELQTMFVQAARHQVLVKYGSEKWLSILQKMLLEEFQKDHKKGKGRYRCWYHKRLKGGM